MRLRMVGWIALALLVACGEASPTSPDSSAPAGGGSVASPGSDAGILDGSPPPIGDDGGQGVDSGADGSSVDASPDSGARPLSKVGSLVVLGDSISDGGGQGPFYYNLLRADLNAKFGGITYRNAAQSGSRTPALSGQIDGLPNSLPGPVAVCITSGGNDMKAALPQIVLGADAAARAQMATSVRAALTKLLAPGRFGAGVEVRVFEATIYDASDGKGDFGSHGCAFGQGLPAFPSAGFFGNWNGAIAGEVAARGQVLADLHRRFGGHGYSGSPSWFASDCTHPNTLGHDQLRRMFYEAITGQTLP